VIALLHVDDPSREPLNGRLDWAASTSPSRAWAGPGVSVLPVLSSDGLLSATEIVEFTRFATRLGVSFAIRLPSTPEASHAFRGRFYCSAGALAAYLLPHEPRLTILGAASLDRCERASLARIDGVISIELTEASSPAALWRLHAPLLRQRRAALHLRAGTAATVLARFAADTAPERVDGYVDALTRGAATAFGLAEVGALAPGMQADLCAFDAEPADVDGAGSARLLSLYATRRPAFTLVGGQLAGDDAAAPAATTRRAIAEASG